MRIKNGEGLNQGRGLVIIVLLLAAVYSWVAVSVSGAVSKAVFGVVFAGIAVFFVRSHFVTKRRQDRTWVQIDGTTVEWSKSPEVLPAYSPSGTLDLREATAITVVPSSFELKTGLKPMTVRLFAVEVTLADDRKVLLPVATPTRQVGVAMQRLLGALAAVPGIVPVDASALDGLAPSPLGAKTRV